MILHPHCWLYPPIRWMLYFFLSPVSRIRADYRATVIVATRSTFFRGVVNGVGAIAVLPRSLGPPCCVEVLANSGRINNRTVDFFNAMLFIRKQVCSVSFRRRSSPANIPRKTKKPGYQNVKLNKKKRSKCMCTWLF